MNLKPYPRRVCEDCGEKRGKRWTVSTWHEHECDVCGEVTAVTEPRDFGYPVFPGHEEP